MQQEYQSALSLLSDEGFMNTGTMTETSCKLEWVREGGEDREREGGWGVSQDRYGKIYVAEWNNNRISIYNN